MAFQNLFSGMTIRTKMAGGFALLLLLTILVGVVGNSALESYSQRSDIVAKLGQVNTSLTEARVEEKNFLLSGSTGNVQASRAHGDRVLEITGHIQPLLTTSADISSLNSIEDDVEQYQSLMAKVETNINQREEALDRLETKARILGSSLKAQSSLFFASAIFEDMRRSERKFLVERDSDSVQSYLEDAERMQGPLRSAGISAEETAKVTKALDAYTGEFRNVVTLTESGEQLSNDMVATARRVMESANSLREAQVNRMESERRQATTLIFGATGIAVLLGILMAYLITKAITSPINHAVSIATEVASGNLSIHIDNNRTDEIGRLMAALATMVTGLRELVRSIESGAADIAASAEQLSTVTGQTSNGINLQKHETDQVAAAMNQMTATVADVARNAEKAFTVAADAASQATEGELEVRETVSQVNRLTQEVNQSMEIIHGLQGETANIGTVLDVIKSVAEQTNLLALNAAIEAARAGEQGRGFAVVADEVRSLAQRTQSSAQEIESLVSSLQSSAETSVTAMEASASLASDTLKRATATGASIGRITQSVEEIKQYNSQIATASEQQTSVAEEINRNITSIRDITDQSAVSSNQTANASSELARLGGELQTLISRFRL
ncbi:methyl-accepting chemotaxis protein [Streptosporangium jomthongense]|uniref:Methyl-accepting chemotaxis protein n=1 Tax=Marinobacter aromaticivorans TaxID=1494078 RepID=A0ABW2IXQ7_9GAMM|nr:methyl-accepting chemotaxis protein [Marinobacter aromaticivorans]GGE71443.1 methyl-accepting chemotaxis protein [Streptosporangium jomthongense]